MRRVPKPLLMVLGVVLLFNVAWSITTPALQAPDETSHWSYVQTIGELNRLPGDPKRPVYSSELNQAGVQTNVQPTIFWPYADPEWSRPHEQRWEREQKTYDRKDTGGENPAWTYPPLYYAYEAVAYKAVKGGDFFDRLGVMRIASSLWLILNALGAWLLAGELFRRRSSQVIAAATIGLWPMLSFVTASINPDGALYALWTCALWMSVRVLRRGLTPRDGLALGAFVAAAMLTKAQTITLLPCIFALLVWMIWQAPAGTRRRVLAGAGATLGAIAVPVLAWKLLSTGNTAYSEVANVNRAEYSTGFKIREFASYLWQFYLPRLDFMTPVAHHVPVISDRPVMNTWIGTTFGVFGWVTVWFPRGVYTWFAVITGVIALLCAFASVRWVLRRRSAWREDLPPFAFLAGTALVTLGAIHWTDYQFYIDKTSGLFAQGRYLFPIAGVFAMCVAWAIGTLPRAWRGVVGGLWLAGLVVFQVAALGLIVSRWYA